MDKEILSVKIRHMDDENPDLSYIGSFGSSAKSDYAINHRERGGSRREYEWFNPPIENYKGDTEENITKYCEQDYKRMLSYGNNWWMIGIRADAVILVGNIRQDITSGGLWGIESDSDKSYFKEVEEEQIAELREQLEGIGFSPEEIDKAFEDKEEGD